MKYLSKTLILCFLIFSCSQKGKKEFESAEVQYNAGNILKAKELYENFIAQYPTSKWRPIADRQLNKCNQIVNLRQQAQSYENHDKYAEARKLYFQIFAINRNAIDTTSVYTNLRTKDNKYLAELKKKEVERQRTETIKRQKIQEHRKDQISDFNANLLLYIHLVNSILALDLQGVRDLASASEGYHEVFTKVWPEYIDKATEEEEYKKLHKQTSDLYYAIKEHAINNRKECVTEIEKTYNDFRNFQYFMKHPQQFNTTSGFMNKLLRLSNDISFSLDYLRENCLIPLDSKK